jgi:PAS domain S-box-containing protein
MNTLIKILFVEDVPNDVELAERELCKEGMLFNSVRVDTEPELCEALIIFCPDIVICDYSMPTFDGKQALEIILKHDINIPIIMFTGSVREHIAVDCMKAGASDYVIKEHIARLPFAIKEALHKRLIRIEAEGAINELISNRNRLLSLFENSPVSLREEDYSAVKIYLDNLAAKGVKNFREYFNNNPEEVKKCKSLIKIVDVNQKCLEVFGAKNKKDYISDAGKHGEFTMEEIFIAISEGKHYFESDFQHKIYPQGVKNLHFTLSVIPGYENTLEKMIVNFFDITESVKAKNELATNLKLIEKVLETSPNLVYIYDLSKNEYVYANRGIIDFLGYTQMQIKALGSDLFNSILHPDDSRKIAEHHKKFEKFSFGKVSEVIYRMKHADGQWRWLQSRDVLFSKNNGGKSKEILGTAIDITDRILYEEKIKQANIQLKKLNSHLVTVRENERTLISREIHDQLGQSLTALKMDLTCFLNDSIPDQESMAKLEGMIDLVSGTISDVQRISSELRPGVLDDLGLSPAIEWYCDEFEHRTGLQVKLNLNNVQSENMNDNLTLYRVLQESLTNVIRHAQATSVTIKLKKINKCISLTVKDDGIGITKEKIKASGSLGLRGMYERVKQSGGTIQLLSPNNSGTKIQVYIPIKSSD